VISLDWDAGAGPALGDLFWQAIPLGQEAADRLPRTVAVFASAEGFEFPCRVWHPRNLAAEPVAAEQEAADLSFDLVAVLVQALDCQAIWRTAEPVHEWHLSSRGFSSLLPPQRVAQVCRGRSVPVPVALYQRARLADSDDLDATSWRWLPDRQQRPHALQHPPGSNSCWLNTVVTGGVLPCSGIRTAIAQGSTGNMQRLDALAPFLRDAIAGRVAPVDALRRIFKDLAPQRKQLDAVERFCMLDSGPGETWAFPRYFRSREMLSVTPVDGEPFQREEMHFCLTLSVPATATCDLAPLVVALREPHLDDAGAEVSSVFELPDVVFVALDRAAPGPDGVARRLNTSVYVPASIDLARLLNPELCADRLDADLYDVVGFWRHVPVRNQPLGHYKPCGRFDDFWWEEDDLSPQCNAVCCADDPDLVESYFLEWSSQVVALILARHSVRDEVWNLIG
jgi:hypothetical protein